jgi:uncharacterized protein (TIGR03437 family)
MKLSLKHLFVLLPLLVCVAPVSAQTDSVPATPHNRYFRPDSARSAPRLQAPGDVAIVNSASFLPGISPGGLSTIFGHNLTDVIGVLVATSNPLPVEFAHVSVLINGVYAPIYTIAYANGEDQISVQVPYSTRTGYGAARVEVLDYGQTVAVIQTDSYDEDPGIFVYQGNYALALRFPDYSLVGPSNRAVRGDILVLFTTGLGRLSQALNDGYAAPSNPLAYSLDPFQVYVAGQICQVSFSGLTPGFVGLYQINLQLPANLPPGDLNIQIVSAFASSQIAILPVK